MSCDNSNSNFQSCCGSPCNVSTVNTAACESLPSQIQNFTDAFFGEVIKTEINGAVLWTLPCSLDVGLPNNPRGFGEGLACYFLRLFNDGIIGLTGPRGLTGVSGTNGNNAYTVTLASFIQPTLGSPNIQIVTAYNPAILTGTYIFVATSGWYIVTQADSSGVLFVTFVKELVGASGVITAGKLVVESGFPGASVTGPQGPQGTPGPAGSNATSFTADNNFYFATVGTNYNLQVVYAPVTFINSSPAALCASNGTYKVVVVADVVGLAGVLATDTVFLKLQRSINPNDAQGSEHEISGLTDGERRQVIIDCHVATGGTNVTVSLHGKCVTADKVAVVALHTTLSIVRLQ